MDPNTSPPETFFRFPDFDDDILLDDVVADFNLDISAPALSPSTDTHMQPANSADSSSNGPGTDHNPRPLNHFRSLSVDADFFDGLEFGEAGATTPAASEEKKMLGSGSGYRHRHSNSMDGSFSAASFEAESSVKKAMAPDRLAELALIDPKRAKRILANRQSAARSKERKIRYTSELERKVQTLQSEATTLSAQIMVLQRDNSGLTTENKELKLRLQALEQQAHLRDALNEALREELQRLKITAGQMSAANGSRGPRPHFPPQPQSFVQCGNHHTQQQQPHMPQSTTSTQNIVLVLVVLLVLLRTNKASPKEMEAIPGTLGWPIIGESLSFISEFSSPAGIYSFINKRQQLYGKVFKSYVLGRYTVFMTGRAASKILLTGQQVLGPTSLLQQTGEAHKKLRRLIAEPLSVDALKKYFQFINSLAIETLDQWSGRKILFTLKVIGNMIMSLEPTGEEQEKFRTNFKIISGSFASLPFKVPGTAFYRGIQARDRMYVMLDSIIDQRRSGETIKQDFLQSLVKKHGKDAPEGDDDDKLTDKQLKDNILTLLVAGHDTTTAALTWLLKFLQENPAVLERLREEHREIQARKQGTLDLTWSEVNNMPYTAKVISETLRMATILPWFSRKAAQDFEIEGCKIKKGWSLNLDVVSIHRDPKIFPNPEKFDPSRFDDPLKPFSFLGFGSGPRMCPGINLAKLEISVFLHHLVCRYKWTPLDTDDSVQPTLVRMLKNKYPVMVETL
ncbi:hypothetical protein KY290_023493 [Solanum tuberosum]|uniref:BZIP domain-containing protein n=2 Tax=Solanum tuberosum TaxID=4113 RepID=A0ABQ7VAD3_SOLTU|nr:hypothetical protein KY290_023493 [Solanum tuberosum]